MPEIKKNAAGMLNHLFGKKNYELSVDSVEDSPDNKLTKSTSGFTTQKNSDRKGKTKSEPSMEI